MECRQLVDAAAALPIGLDPGDQFSSCFHKQGVQGRGRTPTPAGSGLAVISALSMLLSFFETDTAFTGMLMPGFVRVAEMRLSGCAVAQ